jgi:lysophospholipase L1-like esterase
MISRLAHVLVLAIWSLLPLLAFCQTDAPATDPIPGLLRCTTPAPRDDNNGHERFLLLNRRAKEVGTNAEVVFVGDSITQGWEAAGKDIWDRYYAPRHALNLGVGSDHTQHVLWRLDHGNIEGLNPRVVVVLIGVNNIPDENNSVGDVLAGVKAVVQKLRDKLPQSKVLLLGIFPLREDFNSQRGRALQVNQALHQSADNQSIYFLDFGHRFIEPNGKISREIMRDFLHPTAAGYQIWAEEMEPRLAELLGERPKQAL